MYLHREARRLRGLTGEVVRWLHPEDPASLAHTWAGWNTATWHEVCRVVHVQGLAAYLHRTLPGGELAQHLPDDFRAWLAHEYAMNTARVHILHEELAAILWAAQRAGICVMPLKGALLSAQYYAEPGLRPLGDLDLLIQPDALPAMAAILARLGYRMAEKFPIGIRRYNNHFLFLNTRTPTILSYTGEHPDNPRSVELHISLHRGLWGNLGSYDITTLMWTNSTAGKLLGEPVRLPTASALLSHIAIHATRHLLVGDGRASQWVDLALLAPSLAAMDQTYANWLYPSLRLASRALPGRFDEHQLSALAHRINRQVRRWADTVPIDTRCGLVLRFSDHEQFMRSWWGRGQGHVNYWYPSALRMAVFAGELSSAQAYRQFFRAYGWHWRTWLGDLYQEYWAGSRHETRKPML